MKEKFNQNKTIHMIAHFLVILLVISLIPLATLHVSADDNLPKNVIGSPEVEEPESFVDPNVGQAGPSGIMMLSKGEINGESATDDLWGTEPIAGVSPMGIPDLGPVELKCTIYPNHIITIRKKVIGPSDTDTFKFKIFIKENVLVEGPPTCKRELIQVNGTKRCTKNGV